MRQPRFLSSAEARSHSGLAAAREAVASRWGALLALALVLIAGLAVLDDYGVSVDEPYQRWLPTATLAHILGEPNALPTDHNIFYGVAFEAPLLLAERAFGIEDRRGVWLARHLLTHLFFLSGGLFAYLLASRLFGNRAVALLAMLLFLLHPRLYAHSFFNPKDIPFLTMFMIALFLTHRAFRRGGPSAFALLGVGVGILLNLRIMGIILLAAILALQTLDLILRRGRIEKGRVLVSTGAFALATGLTIYVLLPYLWPNPVGRSIEWWTTLSSHPAVFTELFRGVDYLTTDFPPDYVPVWLSISSPPFALLLGLVGAAFILAAAAKSPLAALRSVTLRFGLLLIVCLATLVAAVILFDVNVYTGWRQLYFLWAPFSLLGAYGLHLLASALGRTRLRKPVYIGAGAGFVCVVVSMGLIHPNQHVFFNFFVDRITPKYLRSQYPMDYWSHPARQMLEWFSDEAHLLTDGEPAVTGTAEEVVRENAEILPTAARERISRYLRIDSFTMRAQFWAQPELPTRGVSVYENTILSMQMSPDLRAVYERVESMEPGIQSFFDVYLDEDSVVYVKEPCIEAEEPLDGQFVLEFFPHRNEDMRSLEGRGIGFERINFGFSRHGAMFDGKCVAAVPAPRYSIAKIRTRQYAIGTGNLLWEGEFRADAAYQDLYARIKSEEPAARSFFDVYVSGGAAVYVKEPCALSDLESDFFLHVFPNQTSDLPEDRRESGFDNLGFASFLKKGAIFDEKCVASVPLPEYAVAGLRTGQRTEDGTTSWSASFSLNAESYRAVYRDAALGEPVARSVFDVHLTNGDLMYVKEPCGQIDAEARFFLHVVAERADDLPADRRPAGFDNLDFDFFLNGAVFDGKCVARVRLPDYPVIAVRTGQLARDGGNLWSAGLSLNDEPYRAAYAAIAEAEPLAGGLFDVHLADGGLTYLKDPCGAADADARFFLHLIPDRASDLPSERREAEFDNLDFDFFLRGAAFDGKCVARVPLPDYPIRTARTGQFDAAGEVWGVEFTVP